MTSAENPIRLKGSLAQRLLDLWNRQRKETRFLNGFVPKELRGKEVDLQTDQATVLRRICEVLPQEIVWGNFSSTKNQTGGIRKFPYCRVDSEIVVCGDRIGTIEKYPDDEGLDNYLYEKASLAAMRALVWVEVGFRGLENLAVSPASRNWGHFGNDEERARGIMTSGKEVYDKVLKRFAAFRKEHQKTDDCFSKYGIEYLLPQASL